MLSESRNLAVASEIKNCLLAEGYDVDIETDGETALWDTDERTSFSYYS